ncbi:MAG: hypothetical protein IPH31_06435 [Lewinellaceae bacterium]|nr:hypothetical protein [Lewinellaceae bacterium]
MTHATTIYTQFLKNIFLQRLLAALVFALFTLSLNAQTDDELLENFSVTMNRHPNQMLNNFWKISNAIATSP